MSWEKMQLSEIALIRSGGTPLRSNTKFYNGSIPWAKISDLDTPSGFVDSTEEQITEEGLRAVRGRLFHPGTILFAMYGSVGKTAVAGVEMYSNQAILGIQPDASRLNSRFLLHWLKSIKGELNEAARGVAQQNLNAGQVKSLKVPLPPLPIQQRIAAVLDEVDALRQKRERSINSLEALRESAYILHLSENQSSSTRVRVSEIVDTHRGGMRTGPFGSQLLHSEFVDDPDGIMVLGIDNAVKNRFRYTGDRYITPEKYEGLRRYTVHPGDVLVTIMGTCGRVAIVPSDIPTAINTKHLCAMTLNERCLPEYLHATLTYNHSVLRQMGASARGAIMDGLNMSIISGLQFDLPDISAQRKLQEVFADIDSLTNKALHAREIEDTLLSSIQTRAFNGELNLREIHLS